MKSWNRFNGFRKIPVFPDKPLKRLIICPSRPNLRLKPGQNEKFGG